MNKAVFGDEKAVARKTKKPAEAGKNDFYSAMNPFAFSAAIARKPDRILCLSC